MDMNVENRIDLQFLYGLALQGNLAIFRWCMEMKLIPTDYICPKCGRSMKLLERRDISDGYIWTCRVKGENNHHIKRTLRKNTWFGNSHLTISESLIMSYLWMKDAKSTFIMDELGLSYRTTLDWLYYLRELCVEICVKESTVLGGEGVVVEIEEREFFRRENVKGKRAKGKWIIIGIEKESSKFFFRVIESNSKAVLLHTVKEWLLPGSVVVSKSWKKRKFLQDRQFINQMEEYNMTFKQLDLKFDSYLFESIFKEVKSMIRVTYSDDTFNVYLAEYIWRRAHNNNARSLIKSFFKAVPEIYPPRNSDSED